MTDLETIQRIQGEAGDPGPARLLRRIIPVVFVLWIARNVYRMAI